MSQQEPFNYEFNCSTLADYDLKLILPTKQALITLIFERSASLLSKRGVNVPKDSSEHLEKVNIIPVTENLYPLIKTFTKKLVKRVYEIVKIDNIVCLSCNVKRCTFIRDSTDKTKWLIEVEFEGNYKTV